jgi:succinate-semialdehyde dehydrogenase/glutarate-semialdehyde dehydrogenase
MAAEWTARGGRAPSIPGIPTDLYIGGSWVPSSSGARFPVVDPATEETVASVANASISDGLAAVLAATTAMAGWSARPPRDRAEVLRRAYEEILRERELLARIITLENGKPRSDALAEVTYAAEFFRWYSEEAVRNLGQLSRAPSSGARILVQHKPAGVALLVTPWNYPLAMATRKIGPALAAGCAVVVKPAAETPLTLLALIPLLERAGVPAGVVNAIPTDNPSPLIAALLDEGRVRVVSFTGSTAVGRVLIQAAAAKVVRPVMELGGSAPFVVFEDADVAAAVEGAMIAKMRNMGEACTAANRFLVHDTVKDEFSVRLTERMAALKMGHGLEDGVSVGPLVNAKARDKVATLVDDAVSKGARILTGGQRPSGKGFFYPPTVLGAVPLDARVLREEVFGPVAPISSFADEADAIRRANDTDFGLAAYVYTRDLRRGLRVCEQLDVGMVALNRGMLSDPAAPFGGTKQSGLGREGAHEGLMEFVDTQYVSVEW